MRDFVEQKLRRAVPTSVWPRLDQEGYGAEWEEIADDVGARSRLANEVVERIRVLERTVDHRSPRKVTPRPPDARALLIAHLCAQDARRWPAVRRFRAQALGGQLLKMEEASEWIRSKLDPPMSVPHRVTIELPAGHELIEEQGEKGHRWRVQPPLALDLLMETERLPSGVHIGRAGPAVEISSSCPIIAWADPGDNWIHHQAVPKGGVLDRLRELAVRLAGSYNWAEAAATVFVLTDVVPPIRYLTYTREDHAFGRRGRGRYRSTISVTAEAWVQPRDVLAAYRAARRELGSGKTFPIHERLARLAVFIESLPRGLSWEEKRRRWNAQGAPNGPDIYESTKTFNRDYLRVMAQIGSLVRLHGEGDEGLPDNEGEIR